jgi:hypothetical protein
MNFAEFKLSLNNNHPPDNFSVHLKALWFDAKDDWNKAHNLADSIEDKNAYWIHAYLHRKEGDRSNANYWYHKAGKPMPDYSLEKEWNEIAEALLK